MPNIKREQSPEEIGEIFHDLARGPQAIDVQTGSGTGGAKATKKKAAKKAAAEREWNYTYMPPDPEQRKKNGRVEGRNLITWNRPRMAEKLLLHIMYECSRHRVEIPWDHVAHRLHPGSTGGAVVQHLNRLRASLIAEGHLVPPICQKPGSRVFVDPHIRGYIRKFPESDDLVTTRSVGYNEPHEDRRFNLPDSWDTFRPAVAARNDDYPESSPASPPVPPVSNPDSTVGRGVAAKPRAKRASTDRVRKWNSSPDPADLDADSDYEPGPRPARKQAKRNPRPSRATSSGTHTAVDVEYDEQASKNRAQIQSLWENSYLVIDDEERPVDNSNVFGGMSRDLINLRYGYQGHGMPASHVRDNETNNHCFQYPPAGVDDVAHGENGYTGHGYAGFQPMRQGHVQPTLGRGYHGVDGHPQVPEPVAMPVTHFGNPNADDISPRSTRSRGPVDDRRAIVDEPAGSAVGASAESNASMSEAGLSQDEDTY